MHCRARFSNRSDFYMQSFLFDDTGYKPSDETSKIHINSYNDVSELFNNAQFIDFKGVSETLKDFICKVNAAIDKKEQQLLEFEKIL